MTKQEIFDTVVKHLADQGCRSITHVDVGTRYCAYRGEHGRKCAIGCLIPDSEYVPRLECHSVGDIARAGFSDAVTELVDAVGADFLLRLQRAHDQPVGGAGVLRELRKIAEEYGLSAQ